MWPLGPLVPATSRGHYRHLGKEPESMTPEVLQVILFVATHHNIMSKAAHHLLFQYYLPSVPSTCTHQVTALR